MPIKIRIMPTLWQVLKMLSKDCIERYRKKWRDSLGPLPVIPAAVLLFASTLMTLIIGIFFTIIAIKLWAVSSLFIIVPALVFCAFVVFVIWIKGV